MSELDYKITYLNGDKSNTIRVRLTGKQINGMRTLISAIPTLRNLYGDKNRLFQSVYLDRDLLRIELDTSEKDILEDLTKVSKELSDDETVLQQIYKLFEDPQVGPLNELEFIDVFGEDISPGVIVTDGAVESAGNIPVESNFSSIEDVVTLLSFESKDGSNTVLIKNDHGEEFESGVLYILKLLITAYNLNYANKASLPVIYSLRLSEPTKLIGFINSSDLDIEATTRLQY